MWKLETSRQKILNRGLNLRKGTFLKFDKIFTDL